MSIAKQSKQSHDKPAGHASTDASQLGPGKQTMVQARAAEFDGVGGGGVDATESKDSHHKESHHHRHVRKKTENEAVFELGEYSQRVKDAFDDLKDKVGKSKNLQQAASTALGAAGSLLADKVGEGIGKGLGFVIGKITDKIAESLGEKFPELGGDKKAADYLGRAEHKLRHIIHSEAQHIPDHKASIHELHELLHFLRSDAANKDTIKNYVEQKLSGYQNSVELMYEKTRHPDPNQDMEPPILGRVPDPKRGYAVHLAVVQATKHHEPTDSPFTAWHVLNFVPDGVGPEAYAVMGALHGGQKIQTFTLINPSNLTLGIKPA